ncbi:helix-turn-helix domain-containing protein [Paenibacillus sp. NPDC057934]|uniref:helix-turn-helix domain-containing protein n=1 Tax=Paenibacillus sp. NPDC057934 TaxID=3346282 RepID=UPI0036DAF683
MEAHKGQVVVSTEKQFVYQDSVNRGHVQLPRMVVHSLNLSGTAKIAYGVISGYVFEQGRSAFPSISRIAMACNCSKKTAIKYVDELVEKGFIQKERNGNGRTNTYYLVDIDKIPHLHVSEMFWRAVNKVNREIKTCLYENVYDCIMDLISKINYSGTKFRDISVNDKTELGLKETLLEMVNKDSEDTFKPQNYVSEEPNMLFPPQQSTTTSVLLAGDPKKVGDVLGGRSRYCLPDDVTKWKNDNFVQYFYEKFINATDKTHEVARNKHRGMVERILKNQGGDKTKVKHLIDSFFEMKYDPQSLEVFCTSGRIVEIELFIEKGKRPYYLVAKDKKIRVSEEKRENYGISAKEFLERIKQSDIL